MGGWPGALAQVIEQCLNRNVDNEVFRPFMHRGFPWQTPTRENPPGRAYFSGLQKNDGKGVNGTGTYPFTGDCDRIENGSHTTNVPRPPNEPQNTINGFALDCMAQFKLGYYFVVQSIHHRRYPVVDAERGVVWSHAIFDQGTVNKGVLSTGQEYTFRGFNRPSSILVNEAFLIENGKIRRVEMVGPGTTYHTNSPWPGNLSGN